MTALDPLMAGFAAGASAFIILAMPGAQFEEAVTVSGLPMILPAAAPPLGMTARLAAMAAAAVASFALVLLVLRALDKPAPQTKRRPGPVEIDLAPPKLRRADAHPDAPSRRPILAGVDLGRPFDEVAAEPEAEASGEAAAADAFVSGSQAEEEEPFFSTEVRSEPAEEPVDLVDESLDGIGLRRAADGEEEPSFEPFNGAAASVAPHEEELTDVARIQLRQPDDRIEEISIRSEEATDIKGETIPELMARLEAGLRRRQPESRPAAAAPQAGQARSAVPDQIDQRLRGAIEELQKLAARGN